MAAQTQAPAQAAPGGGGGGQELDLTKPGVLWAKVENEGTTTFYLVTDNATYTEQFLDGNGQVNPQDLLMKPFAVSFQDAQKDGMAKCDLGKGRAAEIMANLSERYARGEKRVEKVKALYVAKARDGNKIPASIISKVKPFALKAIPTITLSPGENTNDKTFVTVNRFKAGVKEFTVEIKVTGPLDEVELKTDPPQDMTVGGQKGKGKLTIKLQEGGTQTIKVAVPLKAEVKKQTINHPATRWGCHPSHCPGNYGRDAWTETQEQEFWNAANITLFASGTGGMSGVTKSLKLRAEGWGSAWLSKTPPPGVRHNHC
jgi:hypothetical protein